MSLNNDECHPCSVISSLRALAKQSRKILECYWKRYNNFWCRISSAFMIVLIGMILIHHKMDAIGTALLGFLIPLGAGLYKAHDDKDKKNEPVFEGGRECFYDLKNIVTKLYQKDWFENRADLVKELDNLHIKAEQYFDHGLHAFKFIDQVRNAGIAFLHGTEGQKNAAMWYLNPILDFKKFVNRRGEFELDMFKPEAFDPR